MRRRHFINYSTVGTALAASGMVTADGLVPVAQEKNPADDVVVNDVDVLVVGGGTAGTIAAITALGTWVSGQMAGLQTTLGA